MDVRSGITPIVFRRMQAKPLNRAQERSKQNSALPPPWQAACRSSVPSRSQNSSAYRFAKVVTLERLPWRFQKSDRRYSWGQSPVYAPHPTHPKFNSSGCWSIRESAPDYSGNRYAAKMFSFSECAGSAVYQTLLEPQAMPKQTLHLAWRWYRTFASGESFLALLALPRRVDSSLNTISRI